MTKYDLLQDGEVKVEAITDAFGPQVVVTVDKKVFISPPENCHNNAVLLGKKVIRNEVDYTIWKDPEDSILDTLFAIANPYKGS